MRKKSPWRGRAAVLVTLLLGAGGTAALAATPAYAATCTTSSSTGSCGPYSDPAVFTGPNGADLVVQNDFSAIPQTLTSNADDNWTVAASTVGQQDQTSVKSYPATQVTYTLANGQPEPSADFGASLVSQYANVVPAGAGQDYEYAVDDWLADPKQPSWTNDLEVMIWTDTNNQVPAGSPNGMTYTDPGGQNWQVWTAGGATTVSPVSTVSFVRGTIASPQNADTGTIDRMGFYGFLQANGLLRTTANGGYGIDQTNYGLEICSTGGATRTYGISAYTEVPNGQQQPQAPVVTTSAASGVSQAGATLNGSVNPQGAATAYQFDYGTTASYGSSIPVPAGSAGSGTTAVNESAALTGLAVSTTYHYRIEATNSAGTTYGADQQFTTAAAGGGSTVAYDASSKAEKGASQTLSWTHTVGSGSNMALLIQGTVGATNDVGCSETVKVNGVALPASDKLAIIHPDGQDNGYTDIWGMASPPAGADTILVNVANCPGGNPDLTGGAVSFSGVSQAAPFGTVASAAGYSGTASVALSTVSSSDMVGAFVADGSGSESAKTPLTSRYREDLNANTGAGNSAGATAPATGSSVTAKWSMTADYWGTGAVEVLHA